MTMDKNYYPAAGFAFHITSTPSEAYFSKFSIPTGLLGNYSEGSFQKVSGISATLNSEVYEGLGQTNKQIKLPGNVTYDDLVLSRGLVRKDSTLGSWATQMITGQKNKYKIERKTFNVFLFDHSSDRILMVWTLYDCFPLSLELDEFDSMNGNSVVVDTMTLSYSHFYKLTNPWQ